MQAGDQLEDAGRLFLEGLKSDAKGRVDEARVLYRQALLANPRVTSANAFLAASYNSLLVLDHVRLKECKRGRFLYVFNDFIGQCLHLYGEWCDPECALMETAVSAGGVVVDLGANIGAFTVPLAKKAGPAGRVYALEPQRLVHQLLASNVALNGLMNVHALQMAVGRTDEAAVWMESPDLATDGLLNLGAVAAQHGAGPMREPVRCTSVDALDLAGVDLIKVDVEGLEVEALQGAQRTIVRDRPVLYVEDNADDGNPELLRRIEELGYLVYWQLTPYYQPANYFGCAFSQHDHYSPSANLWCVPKEKDAVLGQHGLLPVLGIGDHWRAALERSRQR